MSETDDLVTAAERLIQGVRDLTDCILNDGSDEDRTQLNWAVLRALDHYRSVAYWTTERAPNVLEWVPELAEIEESSAEQQGLDRIIQFATWAFAVTDADRFVREGQRALPEDDPGEAPPADVQELVARRFASEIGWPDFTAYAAAGLRLEQMQYSTHRFALATD